ncbi:MAG TPA: type II toxin-antitoxin system RelE/ParE family toxin [Myxococcota bacterium]|nr:type II toxin-antitoxin system RelE/ParE family toxin [Myxococcota bacterium]HNH47787.1 type II toxin-antitoxin system RelE/ParE family toxin [Myxococcota bacterium]
MLPFELLGEALDELREAAEWFSDRSPELGDALLDEVDRMILHLRQHPDLGTPVQLRRRTPVLRRVALRRFRYVLFYRVQDGLLQVVAVAHSSRRPGYWVQRL